VHPKDSKLISRISKYVAMGNFNGIEEDFSDNSHVGRQDPFMVNNPVQNVDKNVPIHEKETVNRPNPSHSGFRHKPHLYAEGANPKQAQGAGANPIEHESFLTISPYATSVTPSMLNPNNIKGVLHSQAVTSTLLVLRNDRSTPASTVTE